MFLGVVANPIPERDFEGKIFLKRVARMELYKQATCNQNFTDDASDNNLIKDGEWYDSNVDVVVKGMTLGDLKEAIAGQYFLNNDIKERLVLPYYVGRGNNCKCKYINKDNQLVPTVDSFQAGGYTLMVKYHGQRPGRTRTRGRLT